jgi:plastocyanin
MAMEVSKRIALAVLVAACGGGDATAPSGGGPTGGGPAGGSTSSNITVSNNLFSPASTTVAPGTTVTWTWNACSSDGYGGTNCVVHDVTFDDGAHSTAQDDGSWSRTFPAAGSYPYHCTRHGTAGSGMRGTVTVQ